jgi:hypothetical protein
MVEMFHLAVIIVAVGMVAWFVLVVVGVIMALTGTGMFRSGPSEPPTPAKHGLVLVSAPRSSGPPDRAQSEGE